jgi:hypothetical protein
MSLVAAIYADFIIGRIFEASPCKPRGMFCLAAVLRSTVKDVVFINSRSLTPQQATGNALAYAVHILHCFFVWK